MGGGRSREKKEIIEGDRCRLMCLTCQDGLGKVRAAQGYEETSQGRKEPWRIRKALFDT